MKVKIFYKNKNYVYEDMNDFKWDLHLDDIEIIEDLEGNILYENEKWNLPCCEQCDKIVEEVDFMHHCVCCKNELESDNNCQGE